MEQKMTEQAFSRLRVLDISHYIAGPYCTKLLAGLGAEVIKVEKPGDGDGARRMGPFPNDEPHLEKSGLFLYLNTNKKGITLNLKTETGRSVFKELVKTSDVVVENFEPRVMPSLDLSYQELKKANPGLVMTSISNFGQTGPYRDYKGDELNLVAMGGVLDRLGDPDREPLKLGGAPAQYMAGLVGYTASTIGVFHAAQTGQGQHVDVSIMECMTISHAQALVQYAYLGTMQLRETRPALRCKDGIVTVADQQHHQWVRFAEMIGRPEWAQDPNFYNATSRRQRFAEIRAQAEYWLGERTKEEAYHTLQQARLPAGYDAAPEDLLNSPQYRTRGFFVAIEHPLAGTYEYPGAPFDMTGLCWEFERAPLLGEHNREVLCNRLGYSPQDLVRMRQQGVI